jgi:hypothetical protein
VARRANPFTFDVQPPQAVQPADPQIVALERQRLHPRGRIAPWDRQAAYVAAVAPRAIESDIRRDEHVAAGPCGEPPHRGFRQPVESAGLRRQMQDPSVPGVDDIDATRVESHPEPTIPGAQQSDRIALGQALPAGLPAEDGPKRRAPRIVGAHRPVGGDEDQASGIPVEGAHRVVRQTGEDFRIMADAA